MTESPPYPGSPGPTRPYPVDEARAARRRRRPLVITLVIAACLLVLCGGVVVTAVLTIPPDQQGTGQDTPVTAVDKFLRAVYIDRDATEAAGYVCVRSLDDGALTGPLGALQAEVAQATLASYDWGTPAVMELGTATATVTANVVTTTPAGRRFGNPLAFDTVESDGWWVCGVTAGE